MRMSLADAYRYMLGGNAKVVIHSTTTDVSYAFSIRQQGPLPGIWWVYGDNLKAGYYLGYIRGDVFIPSNKAPDRLIKNINAFGYVWKRIVRGDLPDTYHVMHKGRCAACGKQLTDAYSIKVGFGPLCRKKLGISVDSPDVNVSV